MMRSMKKKTLLYAGDSPAGGPANYLLAMIATLKGVSLTHIPPGQTLAPSVLEKKFDGFILSDFSRKDLPAESEKRLAQQVKENGAGLLMVGGWGSFSGPFGKWSGSRVEELLPVACLKKDDRRNISSGMLIREKAKHPMFRGLSFQSSPVLCGLNEVKLKKNALCLLSAVPMKNSKGRVRLAAPEFPLLVVERDPGKHIAALTTDLAPHWCGGWVDWGSKHLKLPVTPAFGVEVGDAYVRFGVSLLRWLIRLS